MSFFYFCYFKFWYKMFVYDVMIKIKLNYDNFDCVVICFVWYEWKYNLLYVWYSFWNYLCLLLLLFYDFFLEIMVGFEEIFVIFN